MNGIQDLTTISVSLQGQEVLDALFKEHKFFNTELGAYLAAAALALALELPEVEDLGPNGQTKWNKGSGAIGEWSRLVEWYVPTEEPIRVLRNYAEAGLRHIANRLRQGYSFAEIFAVD